jgi:hypothetical protein
MFEIERICPQCGTVAKPKRTAPGPYAGELFAWIASILLALLIPALILLLLVPLAYSIHRAVRRPRVCRLCGALGPVPLDSPRGRELMVQLGRAPKDGPENRL